MKLLVGLILILGISLSATAEEFRRKISLEWEPIEDARTYDVEISSTNKDSKEKPKLVVVDSASWTGKLVLGGYTLRVRGRDKRKVPGDWSEAQEFFVYLESPNIKTPIPDDKIMTNNDDEKKVHFEWSAVPGAKAYSVEISSKDGRFTKTKEVSDNSYDLTLPVASEYSWHVTALGPQGINSENKASANFSLWGKKLAKPKIADLKNGFVRELDWDRPNYAETFDYQLSKYDNSSKKWVTVEKSNTPSQQLPFALKLPGGKYKVTMKAKAPLRQASVAVEKTFDVNSGNRSPAAEEIATLRESIDHTIGWFGMASYLLTDLSYSGVNSDKTPGNQLGLAFNGALGGTGRLGLGYLSPKTPWGFLGIGDYSGIVLNGSIINFGSVETNGMYRSNIGDRTEIRQLFGVFYKEIPVIVGTATAGSTIYTGSAIGPHYGLEYWQAISPKLGFQANAQVYLNAVSASTPNGNPVATDTSYQVGFLGSYRLSRDYTGLAGYAYRVDSISYKATDGNTNRASLTGNYLNLYLEWQL